MTAARRIKTVKTANRKHVLDIFRAPDGNISAADIAQQVRLSIPTIMKILDYLVRKGVIAPVGKGSSTVMGGKRPVLFRLNEQYGTAIGIHLRPTEMTCILTNLRMFAIARTTIAIKPNEALPSIVGKMSRACKNLLAKSPRPEGLIGIGIAVPGIVDSGRGLIRMSPHFPSWDLDADLGPMLLERLGLEVPVVIDNESRLQVIAEKEWGAARQKQNVLALHVDNGTVAGVVFRNQIVRGEHHLAGEIGHMIVAPNEKTRCNCGGYGCFEVMVSTRRLLKNYQQLCQKQGMIWPKGKPGPSLEILFEEANRNEDCARKALDEILGWFALGISNLILMYDPEIIILSGPYTRAGDYFLNALRRRANIVALKKIDKAVAIEYTTLGDDVGVIGAATFMVNEFFRNINLVS